MGSWMYGWMHGWMDGCTREQQDEQYEAAAWWLVPQQNRTCRRRHQQHLQQEVTKDYLFDSRKNGGLFHSGTGLAAGGILNISNRR